jgi:hypothetical protein
MRWYFVIVRYRILGVAILSFLLFLHSVSNAFLSCAYFSLGPILSNLAASPSPLIYSIDVHCKLKHPVILSQPDLKPSDSLRISQDRESNMQILSNVLLQYHSLPTSRKKGILKRFLDHESEVFDVPKDF